MNLREAMDEANRDRRNVEAQIEVMLNALADRTGCDVTDVRVHIFDSTQLVDKRKRMRVTAVDIQLSVGGRNGQD